MRYRRQIGRVGFNQQTVSRQTARHLTQPVGIAEGDNTGDGDIEAQIQQSFCHRPIFSKAVQYPADFTCPLFTQNGQRIGLRITGMHNQRLAQLAGQTDLRTECLLLHSGMFRVIEVVETCLAYRHYARMAGVFAQSSRIPAIGLIQRMSAARSKDIGKRLDRRQHRRKLLLRHADT